MKWLLWMVMCLALCGVAFAEQPQATETVRTPPTPEGGERMFFPHDTLWGYAQFDVAPPHNEPDPNLCRADAGNQGGVNAPCNAFARYMAWGTVEVRPFGQGIFRRFMLFADLRFVFGKNIPQTLYTWSMAPIGFERSWGAGIYIGRGFEMRVTQHFLFHRLGDRDQYLGSADLGPNGPWGRYTVIGVRKYFGQRRW